MHHQNTAPPRVLRFLLRYFEWLVIFSILAVVTAYVVVVEEYSHAHRNHAELSR